MDKHTLRLAINQLETSLPSISLRRYQARRRKLAALSGYDYYELELHMSVEAVATYIGNLTRPSKRKRYADKRKGRPKRRKHHSSITSTEEL